MSLLFVHGIRCLTAPTPTPSHRPILTSAPYRIYTPVLRTDRLYTSALYRLHTSAPYRLYTSAPYRLHTSAPYRLYTSAPYRHILHQCSVQTLHHCSEQTDFTPLLRTDFTPLLRADRLDTSAPSTQCSIHPAPHLPSPPQAKERKTNQQTIQKNKTRQFQTIPCPVNRL